MGKNKKPFVDKKTASTYHLVRRSQRDVGLADDEEATPETLSQFVLMPSPNNRNHTDPIVLGYCGDTKDADDDDDGDGGGGSGVGGGSAGEGEDYMGGLRRELRRARPDLLDSTGETYERYTKPCDGSGTVLSAKGRVVVDHRRTNVNNRQAFGDADVAMMGPGREVERCYESIALSADCMDDDLAEALFGDDWTIGDAHDVDGNGDGEGGPVVFEEILDDFVLTASAEPAVEEGEEGEGEASASFDYDAHIAHLMEKARAHRGEEEGGQHDWDHGRSDADFFSRSQAIRSRYRQGDGDNDHDDGLLGAIDEEFDEEDPGVAPALNPEEERALCQKFEEALAEYDSDDWGEGASGNDEDSCDGGDAAAFNDEDSDDGGSLSVSRPPVFGAGDEHLEHVLDDFLKEKSDEVLIEGTTTRHLSLAERNRASGGGGSGYSALVGTRMIPASSLSRCHRAEADADEGGGSKMTARETMKEADEFLRANPEVEPPPEEVLIDGKSYFSESARNPWDCESILSTYSNLDNNPSVIGRSSGRRRGRNRTKKKEKGVVVTREEEEEEDVVRRIELSNKTGLPVGVLPTTERRKVNDRDDDATAASATSGAAPPRRRGESAEEKRARKLAVKQSRQMARVQKRVVREAFREEFHRRGCGGGGAGAALVGGKEGDVAAGTSVFRY